MIQQTLTAAQIEAEHQRYFVKVYGWMVVALIITGAIALYTASSQVIHDVVFGNPAVFFALILSEFVAVLILIKLIDKMNAIVATIVFILYSGVNGVTLSSIFTKFTDESLASTFFITAGLFGVMSIYGFTTKTDLSRWGNILFMAIIGLIIASLVNYFMQNEMIYWITSGIGVVVFTGLTAYDTQKIKATNIIGNEGSDQDHKEAIMGALHLYLDLINLFLYLLTIFGRRR